jgi:hypothetical protein
MSTRSYIGIEQEDGRVMYAYCHWDGYPEGVGSSIVHLDREGAEMLISRGDMSAPYEYYLEKGEPWDDVKPSFADSRDAMNEAGVADYLYVIDRDGVWYYHHGGEWHSLEGYFDESND